MHRYIANHKKKKYLMHFLDLILEIIGCNHKIWISLIYKKEIKMERTTMKENYKWAVGGATRQSWHTERASSRSCKSSSPVIFIFSLEKSLI